MPQPSDAENQGQMIISTWFPIVAVIFYSVEAMLVGAIVSWLTTARTKVHVRWIARGAALGIIGFWCGVVLCLWVPVPVNTVTNELFGGAVETTMMNRFQHPVGVGFFCAGLFPLLYQRYRMKSARQAG